MEIHVICDFSDACERPRFQVFGVLLRACTLWRVYACQSVFECIYVCMRVCLVAEHMMHAGVYLYVSMCVCVMVVVIALVQEYRAEDFCLLARGSKHVGFRCSPLS